MLRSLLLRLLNSVDVKTTMVSRRRGRHDDHARASEALETRVLLSTTNAAPILDAHPMYIDSTAASPLATVGPSGYTPAQIRQAYGFNSITFANGAVTGDGSGTTIAIVDAYDDPNIANDLHQFDLQFGLSDPVFTKVNQNGGSSMPAADAGWAGEIALDVEWAHAIAPKAKILLVEASDSSLANLMAAVNYARNAPGVVAVSMSWGSSEFSGEKNYDSSFTTPAGHAGVTFLASSGDAGAPVGFPAISPNVVGVGGTTLNVSATGTYGSESGWSGSGGGVSAYESQPNFQKGTVTQSSTKRTSPDVAYDSDPNTGFPVYDSYGNTAARPWSQVGGTSAAAPQWAGLVAIADQGRALAGLGSLDGATQTLPKIYSMARSDFHDVSSGTSTGRPNYTATTGYDLVTGRGTPVANLVVNDLIGTPATPPAPSATHFSVSTTTTTTTAGTSVSVTVTALDASNAVFNGYVGSVHFTSSDSTAILPANYTFTTSDKGVHTFTGVILKTAGAQTISLTDTSNSSVMGSVSFNVTPAAGTHLAYLQPPSSVGSGVAISPAVKVEVLDAYNNLVTLDNQHVVTIAIGTNPNSGVLSGTSSATVSGGIATFTSLSINQIGNGYTLVASSAGLGSVTSASFNVGPTTQTIEGFETGNLFNYDQIGGGFFASVGISSYAAHDGRYGLLDYSGSDWIYRTDSAAQVQQGDTISVWLAFSGSASGVAAFGFGASDTGTLSLVASPSTHQLLLMNDVGYGAVTLGAANESFQGNHWYRLEVSWGTSGNIVGRIYDSNGTTLLQSVSGSTNAIKSGGIAFKANGGTAAWDTVQVSPGVNHFSNVAKLRASGFSELSGTTGNPIPPSNSDLGWERGVIAGASLGAISDQSLDDAFCDFSGITHQLDSPALPRRGRHLIKKTSRSDAIVHF